MKTIYFIRHAETDAVANDILAGGEYETPLNDRGRAQAKAAAEYLKDKNVELMMVSPMDRTRETADIIAKELGLDTSKLVESELVRERNFGSYSGRSYSEYSKQRQAGTLDQSQLEPLDQLHDRVSKAFAWLAARPEKTIVVVSHGSAGRMFRVVDQELAHNDFRFAKGFANAEITEFTL